MHQFPLSIGEAIKRARGSISIRELGRRSGVSAGQISRIESGETERPSMETIRDLATALGGSPAPLLRLAGYSDKSIDAELERVSSHFYEATEFTSELADAVSDAELDGDHEGLDWLLFKASQTVHPEFWLKNSASQLPIDELSEIVRAWPALTEERRKLVRAFVSDQEVLSGLDRLPSPHGRYEISVQLTDAGGDEDL